MKQSSSTSSKKYTPPPGLLNNSLTLGEQASLMQKSTSPSAKKLGLKMPSSSATVAAPANPVRSSPGALNQGSGNHVLRRGPSNDSIWARMPGWNAPTMVLLSIVMVLGACIGMPIGAYLAVMDVDLLAIF